MLKNEYRRPIILIIVVLAFTEFVAFRLIQINNFDNIDLRNDLTIVYLIMGALYSGFISGNSLNSYKPGLTIGIISYLLFDIIVSLTYYLDCNNNSSCGLNYSSLSFFLFFATGGLLFTQYIGGVFGEKYALIKTRTPDTIRNVD